MGAESHMGPLFQARKQNPAEAGSCKPNYLDLEEPHAVRFYERR